MLSSGNVSHHVHVQCQVNDRCVVMLLMLFTKALCI